MSNEIIRISNIAEQYKRVDTVMYALNKENLKQSAKKIAGNKAVGIDKINQERVCRKFRQKYRRTSRENEENAI